MGTEISTKMAKYTVKRFWGGNDRGVCLQITSSKPFKVKETIMEQIQLEGFIQLTIEDASELCKVLTKFVIDAHNI